jgi:hypothetical protein
MSLWLGGPNPPGSGSVLLLLPGRLASISASRVLACRVTFGSVISTSICVLALDPGGGGVNQPATVTELFLSRMVIFRSSPTRCSHSWLWARPTKLIVSLSSPVGSYSTMRSLPEVALTM